MGYDGLVEGFRPGRPTAVQYVAIRKQLKAAWNQDPVSAACCQPAAALRDPPSLPSILARSSQPILRALNWVFANGFCLLAKKRWVAARARRPSCWVLSIGFKPAASSRGRGRPVVLPAKPWSWPRCCCWLTYPSPSAPLLWARIPTAYKVSTAACGASAPMLRVPDAGQCPLICRLFGPTFAEPAAVKTRDARDVPILLQRPQDPVARREWLVDPSRCTTMLHGILHIHTCGCSHSHRVRRVKT